jgi:glycosyltransferase involved in cell wall biosynthesis
MGEILLSVIIPYYKETPREIFPLLASLDGQAGIDFGEIECLLVNDGNQNIIPAEFLGLFKNLTLRVIYTEENRGPGVTRQVGLNNAQGKYVLFCDADDMLHNVHVFWSLLEVIESEEPDVLCSQWYEEYFDTKGGKFRYFLRPSNDLTFLHGKVFKTAFLRAKKICFHEKLRIHEDAYFVNLAAAEAKNTRFLNAVSYIWKHSPQSLTRKDNYAYSAQAISEHLKALLYVLTELEKRQSPEMSTVTTSILIFYYFILQQKQWRLPENQELLRRNLQILHTEIKKYLPYYQKTPPDLVASIYASQRASFFEGERAKEYENIIEIETLDEWLNRLGLHSAK